MRNQIDLLDVFNLYAYTHSFSQLDLILYTFCQMKLPRTFQFPLSNSALQSADPASFLLKLLLWLQPLKFNALSQQKRSRMVYYRVSHPKNAVFLQLPWAHACRAFTLSDKWPCKKCVLGYLISIDDRISQISDNFLGYCTCLCWNNPIFLWLF